MPPDLAFPYIILKQISSVEQSVRCVTGLCSLGWSDSPHPTSYLMGMSSHTMSSRALNALFICRTNSQSIRSLSRLSRSPSTLFISREAFECMLKSQRGRHYRGSTWPLALQATGILGKFSQQTVLHTMKRPGGWVSQGAKVHWATRLHKHMLEGAGKVTTALQSCISGWVQAASCFQGY